MQDIQDFIKDKADEDIQRLKFDRQQCITKKNELLAVADFCNELILKYF